MELCLIVSIAAALFSVRGFIFKNNSPRIYEPLGYKKWIVLDDREVYVRKTWRGYKICGEVKLKNR